MNCCRNYSGALGLRKWSKKSQEGSGLRLTARSPNIRMRTRYQLWCHNKLLRLKSFSCLTLTWNNSQSVSREMRNISLHKACRRLRTFKTLLIIDLHLWPLILKMRKVQYLNVFEFVVSNLVSEEKRFLVKELMRRCLNTTRKLKIVLCINLQELRGFSLLTLRVLASKQLKESLQYV